MARTDVVVLGAGIVGTSAALALVKRGLSVALVDKGGPGEQTSYGNTGIIGGAGVYPSPFPRSIGKLIQVALKRAPEANYHLGFLPKVAPWLYAYFVASAPDRLVKTARAWRPLNAAALAEHEAFMMESGALKYLRRDGWISLYRTDAGFEAMREQADLAAELGVGFTRLDAAGVHALEPNLSDVVRRGIHWTDVGTISNPLGVTRAYAARFQALGGFLLEGDARTLHRADGRWRVDTDAGHLDASQAVVCLGAWASDVLNPLGIRLPLGVKRGYHRHFRPRGNAALTRPVIDAERGYCLTPMEQGIRLTTGAEFADRDAPPTPVQFNLLMPAANELFPLGEPVEAEPWMGRRPCFPDMLPVIDKAPGQPGLWLDYGHAHMGLTLGPASGRLLADMITGQTPFADPAPYRAARFS